MFIFYFENIHFLGANLINKSESALYFHALFLLSNRAVCGCRAWCGIYLITKRCVKIRRYRKIKGDKGR